MDYANGKVYRIRLGDHYYVGSTTMSLDKRLQCHRYMAKKHPHLKVYTKAVEIGWVNAVIELIEDYACADLKELLHRENTHINLSDPLCLNARPALVSDIERKATKRGCMAKWREENKDHRRAYAIEYKASRPALTEEEKQKRKDYQREYMRKRRAIISSD